MIIVIIAWTCHLCVCVCVCMHVCVCVCACVYAYTAAAEGGLLSLFSYDELKAEDKRKAKVTLSCLTSFLTSDRWNTSVAGFFEELEPESFISM